MALGYDGKLYILAFDHRGSFQKKMFGIEGDPTPEETERIADAKHLIYEGMVKATEIALRPGRPRSACSSTSSSAADVPPRPKASGLKLAMPVEKSRPERVRLRVRRRLRRAHPEVRPRLLEGPRPLQPRRRGRAQPPPARAPQAPGRLAARQRPQVPLRAAGARHRRAARLRRRRHRPLRRRAASRADAPRDRRDPGLRLSRSTSGRSRASTTARTPRCWPSRPARAPAARASSACCSAAGRATRRSTSGCARPSPVEGFVGFAIGRSIWWDALKGYLDGSLEREAAATQIAENYLRFIRVYEEQETAVA